jgi:FAD/FMN-containing dehydrogenase
MTFPITKKTIPDDAISQFKEVLGEEKFSTDPAICDGYAMQAFHKTETGCWINRPLAVTLPGSTEDVQAIVKICIQHGLRYTAGAPTAGPGMTTWCR